MQGFTLGFEEATAVPSRRELLRAIGVVLPAATGVALIGSAYGFSREEMPAQTAKLYRGRCAADTVHAPSLDAALARLDAAGIEYDRAELAATLRCPICGCSVVSGPGALDGTHQGPPSF